MLPAHPRGWGLRAPPSRPGGACGSPRSTKPSGCWQLWCVVRLRRHHPRTLSRPGDLHRWTRGVVLPRARRARSRRAVGRIGRVGSSHPRPCRRRDGHTGCRAACDHPTRFPRRRPVAGHSRSARARAVGRGADRRRRHRASVGIARRRHPRRACRCVDRRSPPRARTHGRRHRARGVARRKAHRLETGVRWSSRRPHREPLGGADGHGPSGCAGTEVAPNRTCRPRHVAHRRPHRPGSSPSPPSMSTTARSTSSARQL